MARPKRSAAPTLGRGKEQGNHVGHPTVLDVLNSRGLFGPGVTGVGAKQAVKLENGSVVHMRAKKETKWQEDHSGVKLENGSVVHMRAKKETKWQEDHSGVKLENGSVVHMRAKKETKWQENHSVVEQAGQQEDRLEKKPSLVGGGSSSVNLESDGEDLAGSDLDLVSEEGVHGCVMPQETQNFGKHEHDPEFACTACGRSVSIVEVRAHPVLHVGVCENCYDFLFSSPFTKDNPQDPLEHENECRWCGDGGEVILCDTCPKAFCKPCIKRNFGEEILNAIESPRREWSCFVCDDDHLQTLIRDYNNVANLVKTMNRSGQPRKSRTSGESNSRMRSRRRSINTTTFANDTIATIIARKQADLHRKYPETNFTGFETSPKQRRRAQHHFLFAQSNTKREHYTSKRGEPIPEAHPL